MAGYSGKPLVDKLRIKAGAATDLTEDVIRGIGQAHRLVDVKVAAVDEVWSGLKFVRRLQDR